MKRKNILVGLVVLIVLSLGCIEEKELPITTTYPTSTTIPSFLTDGFSKIGIIESSINYVPRVKEDALTFTLQNRLNDTIRVHTLALFLDCRAVYDVDHVLEPGEILSVRGGNCTELTDNEYFKVLVTVGYSEKRGNRSLKDIGGGIIEGIVNHTDLTIPAIPKQGIGFGGLEVSNSSINYSRERLEFVLSNKKNQTIDSLVLSLEGMGCGEPKNTLDRLRPGETAKIISTCDLLPPGHPFQLTVKINFNLTVADREIRPLVVGRIKGTTEFEK